MMVRSKSTTSRVLIINHHTVNNYQENSNTEKGDRETNVFYLKFKLYIDSFLNSSDFFIDPMAFGLS